MTYDPGILDSSQSGPGADAELNRSAAPWRADLRRAISRRIVPHLQVRHGPEAGRDIGLHRPDQVEAFASLALRSSPASLLAAARKAAELGGLERLFLHLLAPAARHLGDLWLVDRLSFVEVTRGTTALHALLRGLGPEFESAGLLCTPGPSILLAPAAGEQHVFGLSMVASFFRRSGWHVCYDPCLDEATAVERLRKQKFDVLGISASQTRAVDRLPRMIETMRRVSANRHLVVLAGGAALGADPTPRDSFGADAIIADASSAIGIAQSLVDRRHAYCGRTVKHA